MTGPSVIAILAALTTQSPVFGGEEVETEKLIEIKPGKTPFVLGGAMELRVTYSNRSDRVWKLEKPDASDSVKVNYQLVKKGDLPRIRFSLANKSAQEIKLPGGRTQIVQIVPPRSELEIKPGAHHQFGIDIYSRWTEDLVPGEYEAWIEDAGQDLKSNKCTFSIVFSKESIPLLLATAATENESAAKRKWCATWLQKIKPDFDLKLKTDKDSPETAKKVLEDNATAIRQFKEFWESARDSRPIAALFSKTDSKLLDLKRHSK